MKQRILTAAQSPQAWLLLLLAWVTLSALRSVGTPGAAFALTEWLRWAAGIGLALTLGFGLIATSSLLRALVSLLGLLVSVCVLEGNNAGGLMAGPFGDHQLCGSVLLVLLPLAAATALSDTDVRWRWGAQAIGMAGLVCLALTQTRSAWLGAAVSATVFAAFYLRYRLTGDRTQRQRQALLGVCAVVAIGSALIALVQPTSFHGPLTRRTSTLTHVKQEFSWQARQQLWQGAGRMIAARPLLGWGLGQYPRLQSRWTGAGTAMMPGQSPHLSEQAHNAYLQTAAETGLIGLALYLAVLLTIGIALARQASRSVTALAFLAMLCGQMTDALANPSWQYPEVSLLLWAGLGVSLASLRRRESRHVAPKPIPVGIKRGGAGLAVGAASVLLLGQVIPIGLMLPVEAYEPSTWNGGFAATLKAYNGTDPLLLSSTSTVRAKQGAVVYVRVLANFGPQGFVDVTTSPDTTYNYTGTQANGLFVYTIPLTATVGTTINVTASYNDYRQNPNKSITLLRKVTGQPPGIIVQQGP